VVEPILERRPLISAESKLVPSIESLTMRVYLGLLVSAVLVLIVAGCGGKSSAPTANDLKAFDTASPDVKQMWQKALEADKSNDYAAAQTLLYALLRTEPTAEQREAVSHRLTAVTQRFNDALDKDDPAAKAALEELRRNPPNRQQQ
jgi:hypothetical protein